VYFSCSLCRAKLVWCTSFLSVAGVSFIPSSTPMCDSSPPAFSVPFLRTHAHTHTLRCTFLFVPGCNFTVSSTRLRCEGGGSVRVQRFSCTFSDSVVARACLSGRLWDYTCLSTSLTPPLTARLFRGRTGCFSVLVPSGSRCWAPR